MDIDMYDKLLKELIEYKVITAKTVKTHHEDILNRNDELKQKLMDATAFLQYDASIKARLKCLQLNITKQAFCKICLEILKLNTSNFKFSKYCDTKCFSVDPDIISKRKSTCKRKYGVENPFQSDKIKQKAVETNLKLYGVEHPMQCDAIRQRRIKTNLEKHGVEYPMQCAEIRQRTIQTNLQRYNVKHPLQSREIKQKAVKTNLERHGVENPFQSDKTKQKIKKTNLERHGVENPSQLKKVRQKAIETNLKLYGVEHASQLEEFKQKAIQTNLKLYGVEHAAQSDQFKQKAKQTNLRLYGVDHHSYSLVDPINLAKLNNKNWLIEQHHRQFKSLTKIAEELLVGISTVGVYFRKHKIEVKTYPNSQAERDLIDFISSIYSNSIITNTRQIISPYELDIYLPDLQLAFEFNGLYWHSELNGKDKHYHLNKTNLCEQQNIRLIHIFENEWMLNQDIVKSQIRDLLNANERQFYTRQINIQKLSSQQINIFLNENHIQGACSSSINYGLFHKDGLVSVMSFEKSRYNKQIEYELVRVSYKLNTSVVDGANKLFKHFIREYNPKSIVKYFDRRWNTDDLYKTLGFNFSHNTDPNCLYFKNNDLTLYSGFKFQKHKLKDKLEFFDPNLTEWENMQVNEYDRIWDCGDSVWIWKST